jgi:hypothetical protein
LAIATAALVALGALFFLSTRETWRSMVFSFPPRPATAAQEAQFSERTDDGTRAAAFDRILIRNIATVPFIELFDLLHAAPPETRAGWIRQLDEMPDGPQKNAALSSFFKTFVQIDPPAAAESVAGLKDTYGKALAVDAIVGAAPLSAIGEMARMLIKLPAGTFRDSRGDLWGDVIYDWSAVDPVAAAQFLEEHPDLSAERSRTLLSNWAEVDPDAARAWLERQPASVQTEDAIVGLVGGWFERDEANALAFVVAHAREENFKRVIGHLADSLFHRSPDEARAFLFLLPNEARNAAVDRIVSMTTGVVLGLPEGWQRPPEEMASWLLTLPKELWNETMGHLLENWDRRDAAAVASWINQLPVETRDLVAASYCSASDLRYREQAIAIGLTITDATLREQSLRMAISNWLPDSREEALAVLKDAELSDAQKEYLATLLPPE